MKLNNANRYNNLNHLPIIFADVQTSSVCRIEISHGTEHVQTALTGKYADGAMVPSPPFRPLNSEMFSTSYNSSMGNQFIAIMDFKSDLEAFFSLNISRLTNQKDVRVITESRRYESCVIDLLNAIKRRFEVQGEIQVLGISVKPPGLLTVTKNKKTDLFIGLHVDSWDRNLVSARDHARNRICFNLGTENRYFLFLNRSVADLSRTLLRKENLAYDVGSRSGELFLKENPVYPIIKICVGPGEAYIAPTDNLVHDATTVGKQEYDIAFSVLGNFYPHEMVSDASEGLPTNCPIPSR